MKQETRTFSYTIPENSPVEDSRGKKEEKTFTFDVCETVEEAHKVLAAKNWNLVTLVNDNLKASARANAYQTALAPHRPSEVSQDDIRERMIRDMIRLGIAEDVARTQVAALLGAK